MHPSCAFSAPSRKKQNKSEANYKEDERVVAADSKNQEKHHSMQQPHDLHATNHANEEQSAAEL